MARPNELQNWKDRLNIAHRKFETVEKKIKRAWNYYKGEQWTPETSSGYKDKVVDNVVFANLRAIVPRLNFRNPKIFVRPKKKPFRTKEGYFDTLSAAVYFEIVLNYYYKILSIKRESRKCLYDALLAPWGIMELGYTVKTEKVQDNELLQVNELIEEDSPFCMRRNPADFRSDPEGIDSNLLDARWIALRWVKQIDDIKKDPRYENTSSLKENFKVKTDFGAPVIGVGEVSAETEETGLWGRVEGWTIWDKKTHRLMDIVKDHGKFLRNEASWPLDLDGFPVETLYFNENATDIFAIPDTWLYMDMQDELNRIGSMQLDHIRRISQRRYIARENAFVNEEQRRMLTHGGDGTIVETALNPQDSILPLQDATISQDIWIIRQNLKKTIREMAGVSDSEAMASTKFENATEPRLIEQAAQNIRGDQQSTFENFLIRIIQKLGTIIQQTTDDISVPLEGDIMADPDIRKYIDGKLGKIAGPEGALILLPWLELSKKDIQGDYIFDIQIGSTTPVNEESEKRDAVTLYQLLAPNPYVKQREGTKALLDAFNKLETDKLLKPDEQVMQEGQQKKEEAMQTEIAKNAPKREADLAKTQMKTASAEKITAMKGLVAHHTKSIDAEDSQRQLGGKLLSEALRSLSAKKERPEE